MMNSEQKRDPYDGIRPWSAYTHGAGIVPAAAGLVLLLQRGAVSGDVWQMWAFAIYGVSMVGLYTASTLYHCLRLSPAGRVTLKKIDHAFIAVLIAGTYTPICLIPLRGVWGWSLFGVIWVLALGNLVLCLFWIHMPRWMTSGIYLFMGWLSVVAVYPLYRTVGAPGLFWLIAGGIFYTAGGVLYALKWPGRDNPRFGCHEIFHVFILAGSVCHFLLMYRVIAR